MLQVRLLGQLDIRADGQRVVISSRAGQSLFAYLLLSAGTAHRRERLAGLLWPDTSDESARKNLRQELWRIRKAIGSQRPSNGEYIQADELTVMFNSASKYWLDVAQLDRPMAADCALDDLVQQVGLYQGELLPGFYDDWIVLERERIQAAFETKMGYLLEQLVAAERWLAVQEWGEKWLAYGDAPEPAYRALMLASGVRGDMAKVASLYQRCVDDLREQLGVEPSAETRALYEGLLKGAQAPARPPTLHSSGAVTFLFTDIEGSTQLLDRLGESYAAVLTEHHALLRAAIQKWNGREVNTQGDAFFVTFTRALDAVSCAVEAQRTLIAHTWPQGERVRVRMGLHTGELLVSSVDYIGMDIHRAARIGDAGHGGQVLLSQTTQELVATELPDGVTLRSLGEQRLKDLKYPTAIYQLVIDGLPNDFPPLKTKFTGTEAPLPGEPPFKGLQYFDDVDSDLFFGREVLTDKLIERLFPSPSLGEKPRVGFLSVIIGASGSGKSSLVRAGLVPALKNRLSASLLPLEGSRDWRVEIITPTAYPLQALAMQLTGDSESVTAAATLMDDLAQDPRSLALFLARQNPQRHLLLVVDQFEELFTLCRDDFEREAFIDNLLNTLTPIPSPFQGEGRRGEGLMTLVITLRADFYAHLAQYPELRDAVARQQEYIGPMTIEELRRAIEEPAKRGHWEFEPGLVDLILRDVGDEPGALPLLSHALLETWKRRTGHMLTLKGYHDAGGVRGAIAHTAENVYQSLSPDEQALVRNILLRLTELGEGTEDTRRRASFEELMAQGEPATQVRAVLNTLAEARLITLSEDSAEVAHEALIREWPTLREWLNQDREGLRLHRSLTEAAQDWELLERDPGALYRGARLAQVSEWAAANAAALNLQERAFLAASQELAEREVAEHEAQRQRELEAAQTLAETQRQANLRLRRRAIFLTGAFILAIIMASAALFFGEQANQNAIVAQQSAQEAQSQQRVATSRELAAASIANLNDDPERSSLLALEAARQADTLQAQDALHQAVQTSRLLKRVPASADCECRAAFNPDGTRLATGSIDATGQLMTDIRDAATLEMLFSKPGVLADERWLHADRLPIFAPGNDSGASTLTVWDVANQRVVIATALPIPFDDYAVFVDLSPDLTKIAVPRSDGFVHLYDTTTGQEMQRIGRLDRSILRVLFSPDGKSLLTLGEYGSKEVTLWDVALGRELLTRQTDFPWQIDFSPDGKRFAVNEGQVVRIVDIASGQDVMSLFGHSGFVEGGLRFSADGARLATEARDGTARIWDVATGQTLLTLPGNDVTTAVALSPDGTRLATVSTNNVQTWGIAPTDSREWLTVPAASDWDRTIAFSPDGTELAIYGNDNNVKVLDAQSGQTRKSFPYQTNPGLGLAFSPDGTRLVTSGGDHMAHVWDRATGKELLSLKWHTDLVDRVLFSPDGSRIATIGHDHNAVMWDAASGKMLFYMHAYDDNITWAHDVGLAFSLDGSRLATAGGSSVKIWDTLTGKTLLALPRKTDLFAYAVAFSPDGTRLAVGYRYGLASVWDAVTGKKLFDLVGHTGSVSPITYSPDGTRIATASVDGTARLWDAATGAEQLTLTGHTGSVTGLTFSPNGARLATGGNDGTIRVYALLPDDLVKIAHSRVTRSLTTEECQKYLHVAECPTP